MIYNFENFMKKKINENFLLELGLTLKKFFKNDSLKKNNTHLRKQIQFLKNNYLDNGKKYVIINNFSAQKEKIIKFSKLFGKTVSQNNSGKKYVIIKPNIKKLKFKTNKKIKENLRYHQTNLGGSLHSDGPQLPVPPKYVLMCCLNQAKKGGSSIIVSMENIYNYLKIKNKKVLRILEKEFFFERRGFGKKIFLRPIFKKDKNKISFRYLREYIEAGYQKKNKILDIKRIKALDVLDKLMKKKQFQQMHKISKGDMIILNNNVMAHGRSSFSIKQNTKNRSLIRLWIK